MIQAAIRPERQNVTCISTCTIHCEETKTVIDVFPHDINDREKLHELQVITGTNNASRTTIVEPE